MKVVSITGERQCAVLDVAEPKVRGDFVKVKIHSAPMCTEYNGYRHGWQSACVGHEAAGEVVEVAQAGRFKVGDRVVMMPLYGCGGCELCTSGHYIYCQANYNALEACGSETGTGTYAQYGIKQDWACLPIPEDLSYDEANMANCGLGPAFGAMQRMNVQAGETVLVTGLGPVGLGAVVNGVYRNARVIGVESNPYRANLAKELGASHVVDPTDPGAPAQVRELTQGRGVDKGIDCTGNPAGQRFLIDAARRLAHLTFVGWGGKVEMSNMIPDGLTLQGSWHYNLNDAPKVMRMIRAVRPSIKKLITHTFPLEQVKEAWELQLTGQCGKVILRPWG